MKRTDLPEEAAENGLETDEETVDAMGKAAESASMTGGKETDAVRKAAESALMTGGKETDAVRKAAGNALMTDGKEADVAGKEKGRSAGKAEVAVETMTESPGIYAGTAGKRESLWRDRNERKVFCLKANNCLLCGIHV